MDLSLDGQIVRRPRPGLPPRGGSGFKRKVVDTHGAMCNVSLREEGVDLSHSCRQQSVSICVSLREEGVDLSARWTMSVQPIYVSLREEGVDLSIWRKSPSSQSTVVSLREEGVDLSLSFSMSLRFHCSLPPRGGSGFKQGSGGRQGEDQVSLREEGVDLSRESRTHSGALIRLPPRGGSGFKLMRD